MRSSFQYSNTRLWMKKHSNCFCNIGYGSFWIRIFFHFVGVRCHSRYLLSHFQTTCIRNETESQLSRTPEEHLGRETTKPQYGSFFVDDRGWLGFPTMVVVISRNVASTSSWLWFPLFHQYTNLLTYFKLSEAEIISTWWGLHVALPHPS